MLISLNWLREYVEIHEDPDRLAGDLTMLGLNVEGVEHRDNPFGEFVIAKVLECTPHPDADKLSVCKVDVGEQSTRVIVCGAPNVRAGLAVSVILPGGRMPDGTTIKKAKLRGVRSEGMICSEIELGLGADASGILELETNKAPGTPLSELFGVEDWILDVEVTPNRPDQLGHIGVAREVAALYERELKLPDTAMGEQALFEGPGFPVEVRDVEACPRYIARYMENVSVGSSPAWMRERLEAIGLRPINNVVDITNYVLHETGHPLHAFDASKLRGGKIIVRKALPGEELVTLEDERLELKDSDLVIADEKGPVALAGIMGCLNSGVCESTETLVVESAYFEPSALRRTRKFHGLNTDSSYRFERDADIEMADYASRRAASLIARLAGGRQSTGVNDLYPAPRPARVIALRRERIRSMLGLDLPLEEFRALLDRFGLHSDVLGGDLRVSVPSFRRDLALEVDLIEEIARLYGYDRLPMENRVSNRLHSSKSGRERLEEKLHGVVTGLGFTEVMTSSFMDPQELDRMRIPEKDPRRAIVTVRNPLVSFNEKMRSSLLPGMLEVMKINFHRGQDQIRIYQIGRVFMARDKEKLPVEPGRLAILMAGRRHPRHWSEHSGLLEEVDMAGIAVSVLEEMGIPVRIDYSSGEPYFVPGRSLSLFHSDGGNLLGQGGALRPGLLSGIKGLSSAFYLEMDVESLAAGNAHSSYRPLPAFPALKRDLALLLPENLRWEELSEVLKENGGKWLESAELFDVYSGDGIARGTKSYAVRLMFRSNDATLTDRQVDRRITRILKALKETLNVNLRT